MHFIHQLRNRTPSLRMVTFTAMLLFVILFVIVFTTLFSLSGSSQIRDSVLRNSESLIENTGNLLDHACSNLLQQIQAVTESADFNLLRYSILSEQYEYKPQTLITLNNKLGSFYQQNSDMIASIFLYLDDNSIMQYLGSNSLRAITFDFDAMYPFCQNNLIWLAPDAPEAYTTIYPQNSAIRFAMLLGTPESHRHGILVVHVQNSYMENVLRTQVIPDNSSLSLLYSDVPIAQNGTLNPEHIDTPTAAGHEGLLNDREFYYFFHTLSSSPMLSLCLTLPRSVLRLNLMPFTLLTPLLAIMLAVFGLAISYILSRELNRPLEQIAGKMALVGAGQLDTSFEDVRGFKEISIITENAQVLAKNISDLVERVYQEQKNKRRAELSALQSQINPHFLYNALYAIRQLCEAEDIQEAEQMIDYLATFYRIGISRGKTNIPLSEELTHVNSYLGIQQMRHEDLLSYDIDVDETLQDCTIVKLTLQPLVENAIHHGILPRLTPGLVSITAEPLGHDLLIYVSDNGIGISPEKLRALRAEMAEGEIPKAPSTYGLKNVHQRLRITYGDPYGLTIDSTLNEGTLITVRIPLDFGGEEEKHDPYFVRG